MKIRSDFVSNSSSSSFIVFSDTMKNEHELNMIKERFYSIVGTKDKPIYGSRVMLPDPYIGEVEFGWSWEVYKTIGDKLNFAALQVAYSFGKSEYFDRLDMFYSVLSEIFDNINMFMFYIAPNIDSIEMYYRFMKDNDDKYRSYYPYIDHQSCATENQNIEIFKDKETLKKFILSDSYIHGGNDNEGDLE